MSDWNRLALVAAAHPDHGFALMTTDQLRQGKPLRLKPWGSVKGAVRWNGQPTAAAKVHVSMNNFADKLPFAEFYKLRRSGLSWSVAVASPDPTGLSGQYSVSHVPPGTVRVCHEVTLPEETESVYTITIPQFDSLDVEPGQEITVNFGGPGKTVIGRVTGRDNWGGVHVFLSKRRQAPLRVFMIPHDRIHNKNLAAAQRAFEKGIGREYYRKHIPVNTDGSFQIENVPASTYDVIICDVPANPVGRPGLLKKAAEDSFRVYHSFSLPPFSDDECDEVFDLGTISPRPALSRRGSP